jgi:putative FmdB family regulatory protein
MPIYDYVCGCGWKGEMMTSVSGRDLTICPQCQKYPARQLSAPLFRFKGVVTKGGGPDKFTADMLGIPLHDLPAGLKTK